MYMHETQCLWYALDKWHTEGGKIQFGKSSHWCMPHTLHLSRDNKLTHYVPFKDLKYPALSLLGFSGHILEEDTTDRAPMPIICMFLGTMTLVVLGGVWAVRTWTRKILKGFRK